MDNKLIKVYVVGGDTSYTNLFLDKIEIVSEIKDANVVLFTGGEDVYPGNYGEDVGKYTNCNRTRDKLEIIKFNEARDLGKFCLCICRGSQLVTVLSGGGLIQHVSGHGISGTHKIHLINEKVNIDITSTHHQMMYPFYLDKSDYIILAKAKDNLSSTYLNGNDCQKNLPPDFVEPEIVYYKNTNSLCIQGHPEYMPKDSSAVKYINVLIREYLEDTIETPQKATGIVEAPNVDNEVLRQIINEAVNRPAIDWHNIKYVVNDLHAPQRARVRRENNIWDIEPPDFV